MRFMWDYLFYFHACWLIYVFGLFFIIYGGLKCNQKICPYSVKMNAYLCSQCYHIGGKWPS